jgi:molybdopterin-guanine dinucleotide biosynthesis protein A
VSLVVGVFVGGSGSRLGGVAKGLLPTPDETTTLIERLCAEVRAALPSAELVLVGAAEPYGALGLQAIADEPARIGPLGGLGGLLSHASAGHVLALACDLPRLERGLIARLAAEHPQAAALITRQESFRNPLVARYEREPARAALSRVLQAGKRSLQAVLDQLEPHVRELTLSPREQLTLGDWDTPEDVARDRH